ncbi:MAG: alpha/beta fold hydrolase [Cyclobacteriaceae bacterium]
MKNYLAITLAFGVSICLAQQTTPIKKSISINSTSFEYHESLIESKSVVLVFHDWFGISDLSFEMLQRINAKGMDAIALDMYKGKSAKTNPEAAKLMNSVDQANVWDYINKVVDDASQKYDNVFIWGFSLGTQFASQAAIRNNSEVTALILFYGNTPQAEDQLNKMTFPSLMVMGSKDNPNGAIRFYEALSKGDKTYATLFIYPNARHAFAQKLFNAGNNYDEEAKKTTFNLAFRFIEENTVR